MTLQYSHFWYLDFVRLTLAPEIMPWPRPRTVERGVQRRRIQGGVRTARDSSVHHRTLDIRHGHGNRSTIGVQHARGLTQLGIIEGLQLKEHQKHITYMPGDSSPPTPARASRQMSTTPSIAEALQSALLLFLHDNSAQYNLISRKEFLT